MEQEKFPLFHSDSSDLPLYHKQSAVTFQKPPVSKWKLSPSIIICRVMTDYFNYVIVHISAWRALTGEDTGGCTDATVWRGPGGLKCQGRLIHLLP